MKTYTLIGATLWIGRISEYLRRLFGTFFLTLLLSLALSGCWDLPITADLPDQLDSLRSQVIPGKTSRRELHEKFGLPFFSSELHRVQIFRVASGREGGVGFVLYVPLVVGTEEVIIYALVVYGNDGVVEAID